MIAQLSQSWWLIGLSIAAGVMGQTAIKFGVNQPTNAGAAGGVLALVTTILTSPLILIGIGFYGLGALAWIAVLARMDLSYAYPFLALNFVLIVIVSQLFLDETVPLARWIGVAIICIGIIVIALTHITIEFIFTATKWAEIRNRIS